MIPLRPSRMARCHRAPVAVLFLLCALLSLPLAAQEVAWQDSTAVVFPLELTATRAEIGRNNSLRITPFLASEDGDTLRLEPVIFRTPRNARLTNRHRLFLEQPIAAAQELAAGDTLTADFRVTTGQAPWLLSGKRIYLGLEQEREGCCRAAKLPTRDLTSFAYVAPPRPIPPYVPQIVLPLVELDKGVGGYYESRYGFVQNESTYRPYALSDTLTKDSSLLRVHFPLDKTTLLRDFRGNDSILDRIVNVTRDILADNRSTVTKIQIIGLASVEGTQRRNSWLGQGRAEALRDYVLAHTEATPDLFILHNGAEAWTELRYALVHSSFEGRDALLNILDTEANLDRREARMKAYQGGRPWAYVKQHILPDQRNSGYLRIYYRAKPDTVGADINAAIAAADAGHYTEALTLLEPLAENPRAWNALAVVHYHLGDLTTARHYFTLAANHGDPTARHNLEELQRAEEGTPKG